MPRRLAKQRMTLSDLEEWPFHTKINIIRIARYLCGSSASCYKNDSSSSNSSGGTGGGRRRKAKGI